MKYFDHSVTQPGLVAQLVERRRSNQEVVGSNPAGVKDFSLILVLISNFFFQAVRPGGNYVGQYCSLLALIHTLYMFTNQSVSLSVN